MPSEERRRPEPTQCVKSIIEDLSKMHKNLQPILSRQQLHTVFEKVLTALDSGLLAAYRGCDATALFTRQCMVADILFLRQEIGRRELALPTDCCPQLVAFAKSLSVT
mmetsp:Transcript_61890/g.122369  ORF Transcript_61890/g.122369 Transcript_61890/m.122369 type:complete len:108 (-) Transcript_61890:420-743(-)